MITLVVTFEGKSTTYSFNRSSVVIGSQGSPQTDLALPDDTLKFCHIRLLSTEEGWIVINVANDPFLTLNDSPFGKQTLELGDRLSVNEIEINVLSFQQEKIAKDEDFLSRDDVEALLLQVEAFDSSLQTDKDPSIVLTAAEPIEQNTILQPPEASTTKVSLKDYYLSEYDDDHHLNSVHDLSGINHTQKKAISWSFFLKIIGIFAVFFLLLGGSFYKWISNDNIREELRASKRVADIAMALTYAQMKNIQPKNQNWSDPEFIKNNLKSVLGPEYTSYTDFDQNGHLLNCCYMLRIYTSNHLSQFLVIAQPIPSLMHWLTPKSAIIIDSNEMELRMISDLKTLNRLLVSSNSLEGTNAAEISAFIQQGKLISLDQLKSENERQHYLPPKALTFIYPDAANLVYNAPRYYLLGQNLINQALEIIDLPSDSHEVALFMHELLSLSTLPNLMLYSPEGLQHAMELQRAINMLAPDEKFLVGYLQYDVDGKISQPHLLVDDETNDIAASEIPKGVLLEKSLYNISHPNKGQRLSRDSLNVSTQALLVDYEDPIYLQLSGIVAFRQKALSLISGEMITLLTKQTESPQSNFSLEWIALQSKYFSINNEQQLEIEKQIENILEEHPHIPAIRIIEVMQAAKIESIFKDYLISLKEKNPIVLEQREEIEQSIKLITLSIDWMQLSNITEKTVKLLQFKYIPDEDLLISYQNSARSYVTQKLNDFLLSSNPALPISAFTPENKIILQHVLDNSWIVDTETHRFYLAEFDERAQSLRDDGEP